jgi:hypothetical protein
MRDFGSFREFDRQEHAPRPGGKYYTPSGVSTCLAFQIFNPADLLIRRYGPYTLGRPRKKKETMNITMKMTNRT